MACTVRILRRTISVNVPWHRRFRFRILTPYTPVLVYIHTSIIDGFVRPSSVSVLVWLQRSRLALSYGLIVKQLSCHLAKPSEASQAAEGIFLLGIAGDGAAHIKHGCVIIRRLHQYYIALSSVKVRSLIVCYFVRETLFSSRSLQDSPFRGRCTAQSE